MILDSTTGIAGVLVNADTNERIPFASWANLATGEYIAFRATPDGSARIEPFEKYTGRARLKFIEGKSIPLKVPSAVDARAALEEVNEYRRTISPKLLVLDECCEAKGCHRLSEWYVGHERQLEPVRMPNGKLHERQVIISTHAYCSQHYRLPVSVNQRGVESEVQVRLARPA